MKRVSTLTRTKCDELNEDPWVWPRARLNCYPAKSAIVDSTLGRGRVTHVFSSSVSTLQQTRQCLSRFLVNSENFNTKIVAHAKDPTVHNPIKQSLRRCMDHSSWVRSRREFSIEGYRNNSLSRNRKRDWDVHWPWIILNKLGHGGSGDRKRGWDT